MGGRKNLEIECALALANPVRRELVECPLDINRVPIYHLSFHLREERFLAHHARTQRASTYSSA